MPEWLFLYHSIGVRTMKFRNNKIFSSLKTEMAGNSLAAFIPAEQMTICTKVHNRITASVSQLDLRILDILFLFELVVEMFVSPELIFLSLSCMVPASYLRWVGHYLKCILVSYKMSQMNDIDLGFQYLHVVFTEWMISAVSWHNALIFCF